MNETHRSHDYFKMVGARYGFMPGLTSVDVWAHNGMPEIPDSGGVLNIQGNAYLEQGARIERWYPDLPFKNPCPDPNTAVYRNEVGNPRYVVVFMCRHGYMLGNLMAGMWARICQQIEQEVAPVLLVGADDDIPLMKAVCEIFDPTLVPMMNAPLDQVLTTIKGSVGFVGIAAGLSVLSTYANIATFHFYPRNLAQMPTTWPQDGAITDWAFVDEGERAMMDGRIATLLSRHKPTNPKKAKA